MRRLFGLVAAVLLAATPGGGATSALLVASGDLSATGAVVWVRGVREGDITVVVTPAVGLPRRSTVHARATRETDFAVKAVFTGLAPATRYVYRARQGEDSAEGGFATAPAAGEAAPVTFLWSGDLGGGGFCRLLDGGYRIFTAMARRPVDFFLFVGDTIYGDVPCTKPEMVPGADFRATTLGQYHARHRYNREDPAYQEFLRHAPVYAIWDDHEVRNDFSGSVDPLMPVGRQAFVDYFPLAPSPADPTRLYRSARWGRLLEVFILDARQYRSPNTDLDGPDKTMLGVAQRRWMLDAVAGSSATWKVVVSSVPLSIPTGSPERRDSWTGATTFGLMPEHPTGFSTERDGILKELRARGVKNLVFLAADVHLAELIRHEPEPKFVFHEMIAGPLSATLGRPRPLDEALNPRSLFARGGVYNFGEVTIDAAAFTVRFIDEQGGVMFTHALSPE